MTNITILDAIMGSGKSTYVINMLNDLRDKDVGKSLQDPSHTSRKFILLLPLLSEVERYKKECPDLRFKDPEPVLGSKLCHLEMLIDNEENIVTTHALFRLLTREIHRKLVGSGYTLIIDEELDCIEPFKDLSKSDRELLFSKGMVFVNSVSNRLCWNHAQFPDYQGRFNRIRDLCDIGSLVCTSEQTLLWVFPSEFLSCFEQVIICTYLFHGSLFCSYLKAEGLQFEMAGLEGRKLVTWHEGCDLQRRSELSGLITIYHGSMNKIGKETSNKHPFSSTWFDKASDEILKKIRSACQTFVERNASAKSSETAWTTFEKARKSLKGKGYTKGWIPCNAKATNQHIDRRALIYLCNWFCNPVISGYFRSRGIIVDNDLFALSAMVQWIWRSRIRRDEPISLFIPSERMRELLKDWLAGRVPVAAQGSSDLDLAA